MKKGLLIVALVFGSLLLSGCTIGGNKTEILSCDRRGTTSKNISYIETQEFTFKGTPVTQYKLTAKYDLSSYAIDQEAFKAMIDNFKAEFSKLIEPGVQIDVYQEGNNVVVIFTVTPDSFDGILNYNNIDLSPVFSSKFTLDQLKTEMERQKYSCSVK